MAAPQYDEIGVVAPWEIATDQLSGKRESLREIRLKLTKDGCKDEDFCQARRGRPRTERDGASDDSERGRGQTE